METNFNRDSAQTKSARSANSIWIPSDDDEIAVIISASKWMKKKYSLNKDNHRNYLWIVRNMGYKINLWLNFERKANLGRCWLVFVLFFCWINIAFLQFFANQTNKSLEMLAKKWIELKVSEFNRVYNYNGSAYDHCPSVRPFVLYLGHKYYWQKPQ